MLHIFLPGSLEVKGTNESAVVEIFLNVQSSVFSEMGFLFSVGSLLLWGPVLSRAGFLFLSSTFTFSMFSF